MSAVLVGSLNAGALNPLSLEAIVPTGTQLEANLTGALALQASVSIGAPSLAVQLEALLTTTIPNLQAGIALGLPGITFSASAAASIVASAELALGQISILLGLLSGPAMFVYSYAGGTVSTIGSDLASAISSTPPPGLLPGDPVTGILLGASPGSWATIAPYFGGL